jgi:hypothetical protein
VPRQPLRRRRAGSEARLLRLGRELRLELQRKLTVVRFDDSDCSSKLAISPIPLPANTSGCSLVRLRNLFPQVRLQPVAPPDKQPAQSSPPG